MKHLSLKNSFALLMLSYLPLFCSQPVTTYVALRSQGQDTARELAGWSQYVNLFDKEKVYGSFSIAAEYTHSLKSGDLAQAFFGDLTIGNSCPSAAVKVSGSRVANRSATDWLADYFYLPTDYESTLVFTPRIDSGVIDLDFYLGLDKWVDGLFFRFDAPIVWTRWNLNMCERNITRGVNNHVPGYFNAFQLEPQFTYPQGVGIFRDNLLETASNFFAGDTVITPTLAAANASTVISYDALRFAKITACQNTKVSLADIHLIFGWNFLQCDNYHIGVGLRVVGPTGSRPDGEFLFEPIVGNGKHWEIGGHFTSHVQFWESEDETKSCGFYCDANITHMLTGDQTRTFDLKGKPFSRYMLTELITTPTSSGLIGSSTQGTIPVVSPTTPIAQFKNELAPVANISTLAVRVSVAVQADVAAQFSFVWNNITWDVGYNFWATTCEDITSNCPSTPCRFIAFEEDAWALKGDAFVYGFANLNGITNLAIPLSATQGSDALATINSGSNFRNVDPTNAVAVAAAERNPRIDNPEFAFANSNALPPVPTIVTAHLPATGLAADQTRTSIQPIFITANDLDLIGTKGMSNKIYSHLSYNWRERECWTPFLGVGGFVEFGRRPGNICSTQCTQPVTTACSSNCTTNCLNYALSQWGVWLKGGVAF